MLKIIVSLWVVVCMIACQATTEPETSADISSESNESSSETKSDTDSSSDTEELESSSESSEESSVSSSKEESSVTESSSSSLNESSDPQESSSSQSVDSSDSETSSQDESSSDIQKPIELQANNIHLYITTESESALEVSALFDMPATEEMEDNIAWSITADEEGTLNEDWAYLLYSFSANAAPQKETGWIIPFDDYKTDLTKLLKSFGLSASEVRNTKNEWWDIIDQFSDKSYLVVYPQISDSYASLEIDPKPDVYNRILLYMDGVDDEITITEPDSLTVNKEGFYALEIGLMVNSE